MAEVCKLGINLLHITSIVLILETLGKKYFFLMVKSRTARGLGNPTSTFTVLITTGLTSYVWKQDTWPNMKGKK